MRGFLFFLVFGFESPADLRVTVQRCPYLVRLLFWKFSYLNLGRPVRRFELRIYHSNSHMRFLGNFAY